MGARSLSGCLRKRIPLRARVTQDWAVALPRGGLSSTLDTRPEVSMRMVARTSGGVFSGSRFWMHLAIPGEYLPTVSWISLGVRGFCGALLPAGVVVPPLKSFG